VVKQSAHAGVFAHLRPHHFWPIFFFSGSQDQKIRLYDWNGKALQEVGLLEANRGLVSAIAFAPDGLKLAVGDVSAPSFIFFVTATSSLKNSRAKKKMSALCRVPRVHICG
jgi:WD40 repeat protein